VFGRRRPSFRAAREIREAFADYRRNVEQVEAAKASLAAAAPGGRGQGVPLAQALAEFEWGLREAGRALPSWRTAEVDEEWRACQAALRESSRRAEALRLGEVPQGYEHLYTVLQDLMEPLEAFAAASDRFSELRA
jgi:hypothetical protein